LVIGLLAILRQPDLFDVVVAIIGHEPGAIADPFSVTLRCAIRGVLGKIWACIRTAATGAEIREPSEEMVARLPLESHPKLTIDIEEPYSVVPVAEGKMTPDEVPKAGLVAALICPNHADSAEADEHHGDHKTAKPQP
jgi:hypothetical protein